MDTQESTSREFLFKPRQFLGAPLVQAPPKAGYISAAVQFTVPALAVGKSQHAAVLKLCERLGRQTYAAAIKRVTADDTKQVGTLVAIAFHVPEAETNKVVTSVIDNTCAPWSFRRNPDSFRVPSGTIRWSNTDRQHLYRTVLVAARPG